MPEFIIETLTDTLKSVPILYLVYLFIEYIEKKLDARKLLKYKDNLMGPPIGALVGCIPQCGFSAASATLYHSDVIGAGTLIAVFLATSDEAIPIMLSRSADLGLMLLLIGCKIVISVVFGYLFMFTIFRHERRKVQTDPIDLMDCDEHCHEHHKRSILLDALIHALKTAVYIGVTLLIINGIIFLIGEQRLETILLADSPLQPLCTALIGLIPGCATSVLLVELLLNGSISFGAAVAGLSTGAGFGFLILFREKKSWKKNLLILACTYVAGAVSGLILQWMM